MQNLIKLFLSEQFDPDYTIYSGVAIPIFTTGMH